MKLKNNTIFVMISLLSLFVLSILVLEAKENSRLILKGKEVVTIQKNETYQEEGVMYRGHDVTSSLKIQDDIDTSKEGYYKIQYVYQTESGKKLQTKRFVVVKEK